MSVDCEMAFYSFPSDLLEELQEEGVLPPWDLSPLQKGELVMEYLDFCLSRAENGDDDMPELAVRCLELMRDNQVTVH